MGAEGTGAELPEVEGTDWPVPPIGGAVVAAGSGVDEGAGVGSVADGDVCSACADPKIASLILLKMLMMFPPWASY